MRFPLAVSLKIAASIVWRKLSGKARFPIVLQLEPLHTCNLTCTGCGRIREYSTSLKEMMPLGDCLASAAECGAPMVSICGGEPLIYPEIAELVAGLRGQGRVVYLCTNGLFMRREMRAYLAAEFRRRSAWVEGQLAALERDGLLAPSESGKIRLGSEPDREVIRPSPFFYWNVHLDGTEFSHDRMVEREGVFRECVAAIRMAKRLGFQVASNTTVYRETDMAEIETLFRFLGGLGIDGHTLSPGYGYEAAAKDMAERLGRDADAFFLTRRATVSKFREAVEWGWRYPLFGTPRYFEFLAGKRELPCSAWAIPTRNARGWKGPCYLITDDHYDRYEAMVERTDWDHFGVVNGAARDLRCEHCMVHCGYEPSAALGIGAGPREWWEVLRFNFGPKPRPEPIRLNGSAMDGVGGTAPAIEGADRAAVKPGHDAPK
jgi:MoaA/NifB/PqqE/SkfB family radical SAM enzyme